MFAIFKAATHFKDGETIDCLSYLRTKPELRVGKCFFGGGGCGGVGECGDVGECGGGVGECGCHGIGSGGGGECFAAVVNVVVSHGSPDKSSRVI